VTQAFSAAQFIGYQRASFDKAQLYRLWVLVSQFLIAATAAASVFSNDGTLQLYLAVVGAVLLGAWLYVASKHRRYKEDGDQARRVSMIMEAFTDRPSPAQLFQIFQSFSVADADAAKQAGANYWATQAPPGNGRMAEMLEESSFWTEKLQEASAAVMGAVLGLVAAGAAIGWLLLMPSDNTEMRVSLARVFLALLAFFLSSDVFGALAGHRSAARSICNIRLRLNAAQAGEAPIGDMLILMVDYNAAVEAAPMILPFLYTVRKKRLQAQWETYLSNRPTAAPAIP
jgi:hypothetical protein